MFYANTMKKILVVFWVIGMFLFFHSCSQNESFTLWQLPSQINTIGNSYVFRTPNGKVVVMDGGVAEETPYLRGFLAMNRSASIRITTPAW